MVPSERTAEREVDADYLLASHLFRPQALTRAMYLASRTEDVIATNPDMGLIKELTLDAEGMRRFQEEKHLVFERAGKFALQSYGTAARFIHG